jgi:hypothetical protein
MGYLCMGADDWVREWHVREEGGRREYYYRRIVSTVQCLVRDEELFKQNRIIPKNTNRK